MLRWIWQNKMDRLESFFDMLWWAPNQWLRIELEAYKKHIFGLAWIVYSLSISLSCACELLFIFLLLLLLNKFFWQVVYSHHWKGFSCSTLQVDNSRVVFQDSGLACKDDPIKQVQFLFVSLHLGDHTANLLEGIELRRLLYISDEQWRTYFFILAEAQTYWKNCHGKYKSFWLLIFINILWYFQRFRIYGTITG